jgi:phage nucleotide-binding protein
MVNTKNKDSWETEDWSDSPKVSVPNAEEVLLIRKHVGKFDPKIFKMLIYGESGTGKTRLASTFPKAIFADIDKGMASVTEQVDVLDINSFKQLEDLYEFLYRSDHSYETVVIDTLNEMQRVAMHATVEDFPSIRRAYDDLPSQSDYGKMLHDMVELSIKFTHLPMRVVFLSQVISRQFDTDVLQPQLIGKNTSREICRKMDVIGYIYKSEKEAPDSNKKLAEIAFDVSEYVVKDRSFKLPATLLDPTFNRINSYWK